MIPPLLAIFAWPLVVMALFNKYRYPVALSIAIIAGYLILPHGAGFDLPIMPELDKNSVPILAVLAILGFVVVPQMRQSGELAGASILPGLLPRSLGSVLIILLFAGGVFTALNNSEPIRFPRTFIPGLRTYDMFSITLSNIITLLPLIIARKFLATEEHHKTVLQILVIAAAAYSLLALYEIRMSPRLSINIYGLEGIGWRTHFRYGGFRPLVFLGHGLRLGIFLSCAAVASIALLKMGAAKNDAKPIVAAILICVTLVLAKTIGAALIALALIPIVAFTSARVQIMCAAAIAAIVLTYPTLRGADVVPTEQILEQVTSIDAQRGNSLGVRLRNEDILLERARQKPLFGWGSWGRNRVYDEDGRDISITDGSWVIEIGVGGWVRYLSVFGLLCLPTIFLFLRFRKHQVGRATSALALVLSANLMDLIPNSGMSPITWLLAGALLGRLEVQKALSPQTGQDVLHVEPSPARFGRKADPEPEDDPIIETPAEPAASISSYTRQTTLKKRR